MAMTDDQRAADAVTVEQVKELVQVGRVRGAGGTPGGIGTFFIGLILTVVGGYLILNQVQVTSSFTFFGLWGWSRPAGFGLTMLPALDRNRRSLLRRQEQAGVDSLRRRSPHHPRRRADEPVDPMGAHHPLQH